MYDFAKFKAALKNTEEWLKREMGNIRTGRANVAILDAVTVESYGTLVPLNQVGNMATEDARSLRITPWDMSQAKAIEKAIMIANLGVSVTVDDKGLRVIFPELTTERRQEFVKLAKSKVEDAKVQIRGHRDDVLKDVQAREKEGGFSKDDAFRAKNDAQKLVDATVKALEEQLAKKEKEITG